MTSSTKREIHNAAYPYPINITVTKNPNRNPGQTSATVVFGAKMADVRGELVRTSRRTTWFVDWRAIDEQNDA